MTVTLDVNATTFRRAMGRLPTGVTLVTHGPPGRVEVMTVNSFTSVSLKPLLILVSIRDDSRMRERLDKGGIFAVHVLSVDQRDLAARFARHDRASGLAAARRLDGTESAAGSTIVAGALACFECTPYARHAIGDHVLFVGRVIALHLASDEEPPLVFHRGGYTEQLTSHSEVADVSDTANLYA